MTTSLETQNFAENMAKAFVIGRLSQELETSKKKMEDLSGIVNNLSVLVGGPPSIREHNIKFLENAKAELTTAEGKYFAYAVVLSKQIKEFSERTGEALPPQLQELIKKIDPFLTGIAESKTEKD